jgi:hypothetical protein
MGGIFIVQTVQSLKFNYRLGPEETEPNYIQGYCRNSNTYNMCHFLW